MGIYRAEASADLLFTFPDDLEWEELDRQGVKLPVNMKFVDLVIERERDTLLIEIKDPSHSRCPRPEREKYFARLSNNSILTQELTPKARDSYLYLHLMMRDGKPFKYVVLVGLDAFDATKQNALLLGFKERLLSDILCESFEAWKRRHVSDCVVVSVDGWNKLFPNWPVVRQPVV